MEKEILMSRTAWEGLKGKKLILAGNEWELRQRFQDNLVHLAESRGKSFTVSSKLEEICPEHYVFLFSHPENMEGLRELLRQLQLLARANPRGAALISDNRVYGRIFGEFHSLNTEETGYACHTMPEDIPVTNLRTAEHYACRLAREEGLCIRVARADADQNGDMLAEMTDAAVRVLLEGMPGMVYNLPMRAPDSLEVRSPLAPIPIVTATGK